MDKNDPLLEESFLVNPWWANSSLLLEETHDETIFC